MDEPESELVGYTDRLTVAPGERLSCMVSSPEPFEARLVRLRHGDTNPAGPGHREVAIQSDLEGIYPAKVQTTRAGSYAISTSIPELRDPEQPLSVCAWIHPTKVPNTRPQSVVAVGPGLGGFSVVIDADGRIGFDLGVDSQPVLRTRAPLLERQWYFIAVAFDPAGKVRLRLAAPCSLPDAVDETVARSHDSERDHVEADLVVVGARPIDTSEGELLVADHFNGKLEAPSIYLRALSDSEIDLAAHGENATLDPLLCWDFAAGNQETSRVVDGGPYGHHGQLVNLPTRAVTGRTWTGAELDFRYAPDQYAAVHFHDDDLEDARWEPSLSWTVPDECPSGVYAIRLADDAGATDYVPFTIKPRRGQATHDVAYLLPTNTYLAYANERLLLEGGDAANDLAVGALSALEPHHAERLVFRHPEWGISAYDRHSDGSGSIYSSRLRPIPNMRPDYRYYSTGAPERFPSDLYIIDWLWEKEIGHDTFTDEDLHVEGVERLEPYRVVLTGTHPEYWSGQMLAALGAYLRDGGRVMYLGGNGFYWVTSMPTGAPHVVEIRRGFAGTRPWTSEPGETVHSNGEPGGQWRFRGKDPNRLTGVGFTAFALSDAGNPASGYVRLEDSFRDEVSFIFDKVDPGEIIGEYGLICNGAAGYEIDRFDHEHGTPPHALRLATSRGRHNDTYFLVIEDLEFSQPGLDGTQNERVGADMAFLRYPNGGAVFSVGSCNWCGSLSHNGYDNNVSQITENVIRTFASPDPLPTSGRVGDRS
jgi:N,N-dimethylformamidase